MGPGEVTEKNTKIYQILEANLGSFWGSRILSKCGTVDDFMLFSIYGKDRKMVPKWYPKSIQNL